MKPEKYPRLFSTWLLALGLATGCNKSSVSPEPITLEALSPALNKAFTKAAPDTKEVVSLIDTELKTKEFSKAYFDLQYLAAKSGLSREQGSLLSRGLLCMNTVLQSEQAKGDQTAAKALHWQRANK